VVSRIAEPAIRLTTFLISIYHVTKNALLIHVDLYLFIAIKGHKSYDVIGVAKEGVDK